MENKFMRVEEVAAELGVSVSYAYKVIRRLNDELLDNIELITRTLDGMKRGTE